MKNLQITKGEWVASNDLSTPNEHGVEGFDISTKDGSILNLATAWYAPIIGDSMDEVKANAQLIAEAGTVANETGMMPREMTEKIRMQEQSIEFRGNEIKSQLNKIQRLEDLLTAHKEVLKELKDQNKELLERIKSCLKAVDRGHAITAYSELEKVIKKVEQRDNP